MISEWLVAAPTLLTTLALVLLPGLGIVRALGLKGLPAFASAAPASVGSAGAVALVFSWLGIPWHPLSLAVALLTLVGACWVLPTVTAWAKRRDRQRGEPWQEQPASSIPSPLGPWFLPIAVLIGMLLSGWRLMAYIEDPVGISQTNDAVFHMNAVRYVLDTADASSLHLSSVIGAHGFYPAAWHAIVSAVVATTGAGIPLAANAFTLVIGAVIWTLGLTWFARVITGSDMVAAVTAVLSGALQLFPLLLFQWGVLYPNALSTAMLPATVAVIMSHPRAGSASASAWRRWIVLLGAACVAISLAQPATLPILGLITTMWFSDRMLRFPPRTSRTIGLLLAGGAWLLLIALWLGLAGSTGGSHWPAFRGKAESALDVLLNGQMRIQPAYGVSILVLVGLWVAWRRRNWRWIVFLWLALSGLYMLVAAVDLSFVRNVVLGIWYADPYRISAFAPIAVIPLAAIGLCELLQRAHRAVHGSRVLSPVARTVLPIATATLLMIGVVLFRPVPMPEFIENTFDSHSRYVVGDDSLLDDDERALLTALGRYVDPGERVLGNPGAGAGFGYMLSGSDVYPRTWSPPRTLEWQKIAEHLRDAADEPAVCAALDSLGDPKYVLDFGPGEDAPGRYLMPGMTGFAQKDGFELLAQLGDASLWRITACSR